MIIPEQMNICIRKYLNTRKWNGASPPGKSANQRFVLKLPNVRWNCTTGSAFESPGAGSATLTKSFVAKVMASGSVVRSPEKRRPVELDTTLSATMAPFPASRIGATTTPFANTSKP